MVVARAVGMGVVVVAVAVMFMVLAMVHVTSWVHDMPSGNCG